MGKKVSCIPTGKRLDHMCALVYQLTYQSFNVEVEVTALKVRVGSISVKNNLSDTLIYQLVVLRPAGGGSDRFTLRIINNSNTKDGGG